MAADVLRLMDRVPAMTHVLGFFDRPCVIPSFGWLTGGVSTSRGALGVAIVYRNLLVGLVVLILGLLVLLVPAFLQAVVGIVLVVVGLLIVTKRINPF